VDWIGIYNGDSGSGTGKVHYKAEPNSSSSPRTGTLTIAGKTFTVTQGAGSGNPRRRSRR